MSLLKATLTNSASRMFGKLANTKFPPLMQLGVNKLYTKITGVDLSTFHPAGHYESLNALFTRELRYQREVSQDPSVVVSPCDALISAQGEIKVTDALQIKGFSYNIRDLLTPHIKDGLVEKLIGGSFMNFYLSPKDYHRYHVPMDMQVLKVIHVPGLLYPVNFTYLKKVPSLFVKNERVILECKDNTQKLFYIVLVGALNVGKMTLSFEPRVETNTNAQEIAVYEYEDLKLVKGEELGMFMMGSTIVMLFEKDAFTLSMKEGRSVRFGEVVASKHA